MSDAPDYLRDPIPGEAVIFAALQHHRAVAKCHGPLRGFQNLVRVQPVAPELAVAGAQAAVGALPHAKIRDFHQSAQMHRVADVLPAGFIGATP